MKHFSSRKTSYMYEKPSYSQESIELYKQETLVDHNMIIEVTPPSHLFIEGGDTASSGGDDTTPTPTATATNSNSTNPPSFYDPKMGPKKKGRVTGSRRDPDPHIPP